MNPSSWTSWVCLGLAAVPTLMLLANLTAYRPLPRRRSSRAPADGTAGAPAISVLIPARNEAGAIGPALDAIVANTGHTGGLEVIILDDHSSDATRDIVRRHADRDPRVRLVSGAELPAGWCGKQHACWQLAQEARHELLVFVDADVRLAPDALARLSGTFAARPDLHLLSGVPRQVTGTLLEPLLIPLIHTILLGYLPLVAARWIPWRAFAAGCGQLMVVRRRAYFEAGGHRAIRASLHDGVQLPRVLRGAGLRTDLFDATDLAWCRMYQSAREVWDGLGKNATEGLGHPVAIVPWSILLLGGHVAPWVVGLAQAFAGASPVDLGPWVVAALLGLAGRWVAALRFRQRWVGVVLHPLSVVLLVVIQWQALLRRFRGKPQHWRGRTYPARPEPAPVLPAPQSS